MDLFTIALGLTFLMLVIGSITDIRWRIVPDWLSYAGIAVGISLRAMDTVITGSFRPFLEGVVGFGVFFVIACVMFYTKMWGGGDSKVLMAMGALLGLSWDPNHIMVGMMTNFLLVGGLYGVGYFIVLAIVNFAKVSAQTWELLSIKAVARTHLGVLCLMLFFLLTGLVYESFAPVIFGSGVVIIFYLFVLSKAIEKSCFVKDQKTKLLEEGDWLVDPVIIKGKRIAGPEDPGLTKVQIEKLLKAKVKTVRIKEGIPFIPNFLLTFLVTVAWGNIIINMMAVM